MRFSAKTNPLYWWRVPELFCCAFKIKMGIVEAAESLRVAALEAELARGFPIRKSKDGAEGAEKIARAPEARGKELLYHILQPLSEISPWQCRHAIWDGGDSFDIPDKETRAT